MKLLVVLSSVVAFVTAAPSMEISKRQGCECEIGGLMVCCNNASLEVVSCVPIGCCSICPRGVAMEDGALTFNEGVSWVDGALVHDENVFAKKDTLAA